MSWEAAPVLSAPFVSEGFNFQPISDKRATSLSAIFTAFTGKSRANYGKTCPRVRTAVPKLFQGARQTFQLKLSKCVRN